MKNTIDAFFAMLSSHFPDVPFVIQFWDKEERRYGENQPVFRLTFRTLSAAKRFLGRGTLGFGEEYMNGDIEVEGNFAQLMRLGMDPLIGDLKLPLPTRFAFALRYFLSTNTLRRSPRNIAHHYGQGDEFYRLYLDESLTYSCAYYENAADTLEQAQRQKYEHICRKLQLNAGESLVDIGCGWGGMLLYAAQLYKASATGCTLSKPQFDYATEKVRHEGLEGSVNVLLQDYRNVRGTFDKFVSVGMFEHVGKKFIPTFMLKARELLKPGGIGLLHTIGKDRSGSVDPWTLRYIFPGGYIPALNEILHALADVGLIAIDVENLRMHYALTLEEWARRFERNVERVRMMFDEKFVRMWRMFLEGSAAGFRWGNSRLYQITFTNGLNNSLPLTRKHLYHL